MKKLALIIAAAAMCLFMGVRTEVMAQEKMAYVDLSLIFSEYGKTKDYDKALETKNEAYNTEREKKLDEIKKLQDKIDVLGEKEKEAKKAELESKVKSFQEFDRQQQTDLRKEQDEKMKELLKDIEEAIKQYSEKEGIKLVFNDRVLVYQDKSMDITSKIIEILNAKK